MERKIVSTESGEEQKADCLGSFGQIGMGEKVKNCDEISYDAGIHPYRHRAEVKSVERGRKKETYRLFPKITKFTKFLYNRYRCQIVAELEEMLTVGEYASVIYPAKHGEEKIVNCDISMKMSMWRINRYEFLVDIPVTVYCDVNSESKEITEVYATLNCCLDEEFTYSIAGISFIRPDRPQMKLDDYLIPVMSYEDLGAATEGMWEQYMPEVFQEKELLSPYRLAERMGLKVVFHNLYRRKKHRGLLFWKDGMVKVVSNEENGMPEEVAVEAGTIVVNDDKADMSRARMAVYHECFHDEFHWLFFRLQDMHNDDLRAIRRVKKAHDQEKETKNPLKLLEWEAREGARMLMMPETIVQPMIARRRKEIRWTRHAGEIHQSIIMSLAEELNVARYQVKLRLLQLGYWQARGALNYIVGPDGTGKYIRPFMFSRESCPSSAYTFVITSEASFELYKENESYRARIDSGRYVYVDGHVCINDPEYVRQGKTGPYMTRWANEHVDECCLRFLNVYEADDDYEFNLNYVCSDEEYNRHYIDFVTGGKKMSESEANERAGNIVMNMPQKPGAALEYLMKKASKGRRDMSTDELGERCGVTGRTVRNWCNEEYQFSPETFIRIVVGLHLPPFISMRFMDICGVKLQFHGIHMMYWKIVNCYFMDTIYEVNRIIEAAGFPAMRETI